MEKYLNKDATIVDLGCGTNLYKKYFHNLTGVDVIDHPAVDVQSSILNFNPIAKFDAALALGSIQYYDYGYIDECFAHMLSLVKSNGLVFWRSLFTEVSEKYGNLIFWDKDMIEGFTNKYNLDIIDPIETYPLKTEVRNKFNISGINADRLSNMTLVWRKNSDV